MGDKGKGPCENCKAIIDIENKMSDFHIHAQEA